MTGGVFADSWQAYEAAGWPCIIPVPAEAKFPPPGGFTGEHGIDTGSDRLAAWAQMMPNHSVALRMPGNVIGIDVDHYAKGEVIKAGADTLAQYEAAWGALPPTWCSTARGTGAGPGPSRILFYQVPPGRYATHLGADVEIIQRHHRYAVVAPSVHTSVGQPYCWYAPDGTAAACIPNPLSLPPLPSAWVAGLAEGATSLTPMAANRESGHELLDVLAGPGISMVPCIGMVKAVTDARAKVLEAPAGNRHDTMNGQVWQIVQLGAEGHPGYPSAILELRTQWDQVTAGENREHEFENMLLSAARKGVTKLGGTVPAAGDPCATIFSLDYAASIPDGDALPAVPWSPYMVIGSHEFAPLAASDALLGRDVLERTWPLLRYCPDAGAWIVRGPEHWSVRKGDVSKWAVSLMWRLMQHGDPGAADGTLDLAQAKRFARFTANASAGAIAGQIDATVAVGYHPNAVELADLDQDHEILWAGGWPYDLRASGSGPVVAAIDPGTPHTHSAAATPAVMPTPLWDEFVTAVWPDPDVREWALRVLSVALTGYPDKALPILMGETDRGKTQVISLLSSVLGSYAHAADSRLLAPADRSHASIVYALKGRRLSFIDEAPRTGHLAQERLKQLTGGAELTGNRMSENPVTFAPTHTLVLTANPEHEPKLTDNAVRSRVRLIPCDGDVGRIRRARAAIGSLAAPAWRAEAPGVLAKMMAQAAAWLADPASASTERSPMIVRMAADALVSSQDITAEWLAERCEHFEPGTKSHELFESFVEHCRRANIPQAEIPKIKAWGLRLSDLGYPPLKRKDANYRTLRVRLPGSFIGVQPPDLSYGGASEEGPRMVAEQTLHPQNPSSNYPLSSTLDSVDSKDTYINTYAHTHTHTQENTIVLPPPPPLHRTPPVTGTRVEGVEGQVQGPRLSLVFDLETASADELFRWDRDEPFVRLAGAVGASGEPVIMSGGELTEILGAAHEICGHAVFGFDLLALVWHHGADWERLAAKARDTELLMRQYDPPRSRESGTSVDRYDLDHVAERLGLPGKTDDIGALKRKHGGFDKIPVDDPQYLDYLRGDLAATARVAAALPHDGYTQREHRVAALAGRMTLNGFAVDKPLLDERYAAGQARKREALEFLHDAFGLPLAKTVTRGRGSKKHDVDEPLESPLAADSGRAWLAGIWERYGVPDPPRTGKTGKLSTGADDLKRISADPACPQTLRQVIALIGIIVGTRTVYQTALECLASDGRVHPKVSMRQASGRWSVTDPGLTVFGKRGGRHTEREIFLPDEGDVLLSFDLSQVDMRAIAGHCQDPAYMALFGPGMDVHAEIAAQVGLSRQDAKAIGHGWNYGLGRNRMIRNGLDPAKVDAFIRGMESRFAQLMAWREDIRAIGKAGEILDNGFGRRMRCDPVRAYTVAPALMGQGGARDIMCESLLRLPAELWPMLRVMVHDEIVMSVPKADAMEVAREVVRAMTWTWRNVPVTCDMAGGANWGECSAK